MNMTDYLCIDKSRVRDTNLHPGYDRQVYYSTGVTTGGGDPPIGGWVHGLPFRLAKYGYNYTGVATWQSWCEIEYHGDHDTELPTNNARNTLLLLMQRNQASPSAGLPIPLSEYALRTQQVYYG